MPQWPYLWQFHYPNVPIHMHTYDSVSAQVCLFTFIAAPLQLQPYIKTDFACCVFIMLYCTQDIPHPPWPLLISDVGLELEGTLINCSLL